MAVLLRNEWTRQPPKGTPIDWGNPLCKDLLVCLVGNTWKDIANNESVDTRTGSPSIVTTTAGLAQSGSVGNFVDWQNANVYGRFNGSNAATAAMLFKPDWSASEAWGGCFGLETSAGAARIALARNGSSTTGLYSELSGQGGNVSSGCPDDEWSFAALHGSSGTNSTQLEVFDINGKSRALSAGTTWGTNPTSTVRLFTSARENNNTEAVQELALGLVWTRMLTRAEYTRLARNVWQIFEPRKMWIPSGLEGTNVTISVPLGPLR